MPSHQDAERPALLSADTAPDVERRQIDIWRRMGPGARLSSALGASRGVLQLALAGIRGRMGFSSSDQWFLPLARLKIGTALTASAYPLESHTFGATAHVPLNPIDVALLVAQALESCGARYVLGGSLASSVSGEPRATLDIDLMVDVAVPSMSCVVSALGAEFYCDTDAFLRAIRDCSSVNIIHLPTATKVDLFIMGATPIEPRQMERRQMLALDHPPGATLYVYTPEDILLQKLRWFRIGGEVSDRQWRDVIGILAVQGNRLDLEYLRSSASAIDVTALLERALGEVA